MPLAIHDQLRYIIFSQNFLAWHKQDFAHHTAQPPGYKIVQKDMGVSENSVPLNPMVKDHYPYSMAISLGIYPIFRQTHIKRLCNVEFASGPWRKTESSSHRTPNFTSEAWVVALAAAPGWGPKAIKQKSTVFWRFSEAQLSKFLLENLGSF